MQKDLYLCSTHYAKAFDTVNHEQLLDMLQNFDLDGKDIRFLVSLYWEQKAGIRINNRLRDFKQIKRGLRQGCVVDNNLRYADDTVLVSHSSQELQALPDKIVVENEQRELSVNCKKTECNVLSKKSDIPDCQSVVKGMGVKQVEKFSYLGSLITSDGNLTVK